MAEREQFQTVAYQARAMAMSRPCGSRPCDQEFPELPSRWCSGCIINALLSMADDIRHALSEYDKAVK